MKIVVFVEGKTERNSLPKFFKRWLDPQLSNPIGIVAVQSQGWDDFLKKLPGKLSLYEKDPNVVGLIGLLDLHGPTYPPDKQMVGDRYDYLVRKIEKKANTPRFRPFAAVHELEAWLLSDPRIFPEAVRSSLIPKANHPEKVNFDMPPKRFLKRLYIQKLRREYRETVDTPNLMNQLDPKLAYEKCPYLKSLLDKLLELAQFGEQRVARNA